jgi:hypothetical protein
MKKLILVTIAATMICSCATFTSVNDKAGKFLASTSTIVDGAMTGWGKWVSTGKATAEDEVVVKNTYVKYQTAMMVATNAFHLSVRLNDPSLFYVASNNLVAAKIEVVKATIIANPIK